MREATYGQLDKVLRSMGFTCRAVKLSANALVYEHPRSEAVIFLPPFPKDRPVMPHHMIMVRTTLDGFGIADPTDFAAKLQKATRPSMVGRARKRSEQDDPDGTGTSGARELPRFGARKDITYGQLDRAIRALGFTRREVKLDVDAVVYTHPHSEAVIMLPPFPDDQPVYPHHLLMVETELDNFGHATPTAFAAELQKAG